MFYLKDKALINDVTNEATTLLNEDAKDNDLDTSESNSSQDVDTVLEFKFDKVRLLLKGRHDV